MIGEPIKYNYSTRLEWMSEKKGVLRCEGKPDIIVACPPEFGGHPGFWSPEDLFLASVEVCTLTTFLWFAERENITIKFYCSETTGVIQMVKGAFRFISITIKIKLWILSEDDRNKVEKILIKINDGCLVSKSIKPDVNIESEIYVR